MHVRWMGIIARCENPNHRHYRHYGGRGIKVCDRWRNSFSDFLADMGDAPSSKHSIDRIDRNGNYEPSNCRWATITDQMRNTSRTRLVQVGEREMSVAEAAETLGVKYSKAYRDFVGRNRRDFPSRVKRLAFERCRDASGIPRCEGCTAKLSEANMHYDDRADGEFDHDLADALLGEPTLENCKVLCRTCHSAKTKRDAALIAKANHVRDRARGIKPKRGGSSFQTNRDGPFKKTMSGKVVRRS
jgi:5-methylcytosine-specific restriction endonuclease McrA